MKLFLAQDIDIRPMVIATSTGLYMETHINIPSVYCMKRGTVKQLLLTHQSAV